MKNCCFDLHICRSTLDGAAAYDGDATCCYFDHSLPRNFPNTLKVESQEESQIHTEKKESWQRHTYDIVVRGVVHVVALIIGRCDMTSGT